MITSASCQGLPIEDWRSRGGTFSGALHDPAAFQEPTQTCSPSWLTSGLAQAYHLDAQDSRYAGGPVLAIEFEGGAPISLNGMACVPLPNQGYDKIITSSFCERRYLCGCCGIAIAPRAESADAGSDVEQFDFLVKAWSAEDLPARQCQGIEKQGRYLLDTPTPFAATAKTDEGVASQSCQDCLDGCREEASENGDGALVATCCTGAGCVCQSACSISSCPDNSSYCCGQDGHCFCSEDDSAFQCPW